MKEKINKLFIAILITYARTLNEKKTALQKIREEKSNTNK